jgi:putative zinc finger/helix-turn-helix YgiT family protein
MDTSWWPEPDGSECAVCGKNALIITDDPIVEEVEGIVTTVVGLRYNRCTACGEEFYASFQLDPMMEQQYAQVRAALGRLSAEEIRSIRLGLGLTQAQLEQRLGVGKGLVGRWERSTLVQSSMADKYLRDLMAHPELVDSQGVIAREGRGPYRKSPKR